MNNEAGTIKYRSGIETDGFRRDARRLENEASTVGRRVEERMRRTGESLTRVGSQMTRRVTLPVVALGTAITKTSTDFETSMSRIVGLVGVSQEQVAEWSKELRVLGPELGKSPRELADALFFVTSAGLEGAEAMEVLTASAKASAAGLGETAVIADLTTSAVNAYGSETMSAASATDILVAAVREGKLEPAELAASMGQVLPVASAMGVTFDEVGAAMAAMSRTGTNAAQASTQLRGILNSLLKPSSEAVDTLEGLGLSAAGLRKQIREEGLLSTLQTLTESFGDNEEAQARVFGNVRALAGVMDLMGANAEDTAEIFGELSDATGALDHAFETTEKTSGFKFRQGMAKVQAIMLDLGDTVMPMVVDIVERLADIATRASERWDSMSDSSKKMVVQGAALVAVLGPLLVIVGTMTKLVAPLVGLIAGKTAALGAAGGAAKVTAGILSAKFLGPAGVLALLAVGYATASKNVNESRENIERLKNIQEDYRRELMDNHTSIMNVKDHQTAASGRLADAEERVSDLMEVRDTLNRQRIARQKIVTEAEEAFNRAVEENGFMSAEANRAARNLTTRREALRETDERLERVQGDLNEAHRMSRVRQDQAKDASRRLERAVKEGGDAVRDTLVIWNEFGDTVAFQINNAKGAWDGLNRDLQRGINIGALQFEGGAPLGGTPGLSFFSGPQLAKGGPAKGGRTHLVGEEGPELFVPDSSGVVIPANRTRSILSGNSPSSSLRENSSLGQSMIENNINTININNDVDGEMWLKRLTKNQEITSSRLSPRREL